MMTPAILKEQFTSAMEQWAAEGMSAYKKDGYETPPVLSHICFKFTNMQNYTSYVSAARSIGSVTQEAFNGKEITWCRLNEPLKKSGLTLEWLELVEPKIEANSYDGVTSISYAVDELNAPIKIPSNDEKVIFRYQGKHASQLASSQ